MKNKHYIENPSLRSTSQSSRSGSRGLFLLGILACTPLTSTAVVVIDEDFSSGAGDFTEVAGGTWSVSSGRYVLSSPASAGDGLLGNISIHDTSVSDDYTATATIHMVGTATAWNDTAFVFGYQDDDNFYYVSINESNDSYTNGLFKVVNGAPTELVNFSSTYSADTDYEIEVVRSDSSIVVSIDSSEVAATTDSTFTGGQFGFGSKNDSGQFDGLLVDDGTTSGGTPLIDDDFSAGGGNFTEIAGGTWAVSSGRYVLSSPADSGTNGILGNISVHDTSLTGDYTVSAVVHLVGTATAWNDAALVFGYQNSTNYYYVSLNESNDGYTKGVFKVVNGTPTEIVDLGSVSISSDTDYTVEVERSGSSIVVDINSSQVASSTDSTFSGGKVGFGSKNDSAQFDDLVADGTAGPSQVDAPQFSPGGGTYSSSQSVSITTNTSGATIRYTTDGSNPTSTSGTVYSSAVSISSTTTLKAIAYKSGMNDSSVTSATYTINVGTVAAPQFSPGGGTYSSSQSVSITSSTSGATIRYTTDGSNPTSTSGTVYSSAVSIGSTTTLKAIAYKSGMNDSSVTSATYTISGGGPSKPNASNTGYSGSLTSSGSITVTTNGTTIEDLDISGYVRVQANNVTIRNCRITGGTYGIQCTYGNTGLLIEDVEIRQSSSAGLYGGNFTARRVYMHDFPRDAFKPTSNYTIESCYITDVGSEPSSHADGVQMVSGSNGLIRWNNFDMPHDAPGYNNSQCLIIQTNNGPIDNIVIDENWINGGGYSVQIRDKGTGYGAPTNCALTDNLFGRDYQYGIYIINGSQTISGNVWEDNGQPAP